MSLIRSIVRELFGLFVDDGAFALLILLTVAVAALIALALPGMQALAGALLLFGCLALLFFSATRAGSRR